MLILSRRNMTVVIGKRPHDVRRYFFVWAFWSFDNTYFVIVLQVWAFTLTLSFVVRVVNIQCKHEGYG